MLRLFVTFCLACSLIFTSFKPVNAVGESLYLQGPRSVQVGEIFDVVIFANTSGLPANAVQVNISYPKELKVSSIDSSRSVLTLWIAAPYHAVDQNTISFIGGTPSPGFSGSKVILATIRFQAKSSGDFPILFGPSDMLANDGLGTSIMSGSMGLEIKVHPVVSSKAPAVIESKKSDYLNFSTVVRDSFLNVIGFA